MPTLLSLALRNITRHRSRTAITVGAIFFGVLMTALLGSVVQGLQNMLVDDAVKSRVGAIQVHRRGYEDAAADQLLKLDFEQGGPLEAKLRAVPGVAEVAPRIAFSGLVANGSQGTLFMAVGIDPVLEPRAMPWEARDVVGKHVSVDAPHGGVVGAELAEAMGAKTGGSLTLEASTRQDHENALDLDLTGTLKSSNPLESKRTAFVPLAYAQELLRMPGRVTEYVLAVNDRSQIGAVAERLRGVLGPDYEVKSWDQLRPNIRDAMKLQDTVLAAITFVFLVIAIIGVVNTMLMSVMERTREIGTMMAVGVRRAQIGLLFILEALVQAIAGVLLGLASGRVVVALIGLAGGFVIDSAGLGVHFQLFPDFPLRLTSASAVLSTFGAVAAALYPAWRAAHLRPVEALREV